MKFVLTVQFTITAIAVSFEIKVTLREIAHFTHCKSTLSSLHATAPSFSPGAVTQSVFTVRHFDHGHSPPTPGELPSYENETPVKISPPIASFFSGPPPITSTMVTPLPFTSL